MSIIGVHPHNANELLKWLQKSGFPDIMLGDFNAGDYKKRCEDSKFKDNRNRLKTKTILTCIKNLIWLITDFKF